MKATAAADAAIDKVASEWVMRRGVGLSSAGERELSDWLAADPRHLEAFLRLARTWAVFDRAEQKGAANAIVTKLAVRARERRSRRLQAKAAAGAIAVVALFFTYQSWSSFIQSPSTAVPAAFEPVRKLPDGSIVELNNGADVVVDYEATIRRVRLLRGEAHFRVEKDAGRPFLVEAGGVQVIAVGTAFTVQVARQAVEVVVTEGRVAVDRAKESVRTVSASTNAESTLVGAGNRILVDTKGRTALPPDVKPMTETEINERLAWRIPRLEFGGIEMAQAIALMNRSNRLQIFLDEASIGRRRVSGVFRSDNPEGFVRIVEAMFDLKAERRGENEIVLRRP